jgi:hypothetical protein
VADIAQQEGKGERRIPNLMSLAFVPPAMVQEIVDGRFTRTITDLARQVPAVWP